MQDSSLPPDQRIFACTLLLKTISDKLSAMDLTVADSLDVLLDVTASICTAMTQPGKEIEMRNACTEDFDLRMYDWTEKILKDRKPKEIVKKPGPKLTVLPGFKKALGDTKI